MGYNNKEKQREYNKAHYHKYKETYRRISQKRTGVLRDYIKEYKSKNPCSKCGEGNVACLDFHHVDPNTKEKNIADLVRNGVLEKLKDEISKCIVLCCNCHRKLHYEESLSGYAIRSF